MPAANSMSNETRNVCALNLPNAILLIGRRKPEENRTDFVLEAARAAEEALIEQRIIMADRRLIRNFSLVWIRLLH